MTDVPAAPRAPSRFAREITAAILSPLAIWIIGWAPDPVFDLTIIIIGALALYEFLVLGQRKGYTIPIVICMSRNDARMLVVRSSATASLIARGTAARRSGRSAYTRSTVSMMFAPGCR